MSMQDKELRTLQDVRDALNDPEVKAANERMSKKYLKNNRPKSLAVVIVGAAVAFLLLTLINHKVSSVTPPSLRSSEAVELVWNDGTADAPARTLTAGERDALVELLSAYQVERVDDGGYQGVPHVYAVCGEDDGDWFAIDAQGGVYVEEHFYTVKDNGGAELYAALEASFGPQ